MASWFGCDAGSKRSGSLAALLMMIGCASALAAPAQWPVLKGEGPWLVQAHFDDVGQLAALARRFDVWQVDREAGYATVHVDGSGLESLRAWGLKLALDPRQSQLESLADTGLRKAGIPGFGCYRTVEETGATLDAIVANHPDLAERIIIGQSWDKANGFQGHDLRVLKLTNRDTGRKPVLLLTGAVHGREYATAEMVTRFAEYLVENYHSDATAGWILDHREVHLLLVTNPDGRKRAEAGVLWRKNVNNDHCPGANPGQGVDLNRNFPFGWGQFEGSSDEDCEAIFRGIGPESEPEVQALASYMDSLFGDHRPSDLVTPADDSVSGLYLDIHSYGRLVLWPWGYQEVPVPNGAQLELLARRLAWYNRYRPGQELSLYPIDGSTAQYAYGELGVGAVTFELGDFFFESCSRFEEIVAGNLPALQYAAKVADFPYRTTLGPDVSELLVLPGSAAPGEPVTVQLAGTDAQVNRLGGTAPIDGVVAFEVQVESIEDGTVVHQAVTQSGASARVELPTADLPLGRYRVNTRAQDETGARGPWYSAWLDVVDPTTTGVLVGTVRSATDNSALRAVVQTDQGLGASDPLSGTLRMRLPAGSHAPQVEAPGFVSQSLAPTSLDAGSVRPLVARLQPLCEVFTEDAENGLPGWTGSGTWGVTNQSAAHGQFSLTDSPGGPYSPGINVAASPAFDLVDAVQAELVFSYRCNTEPQADFGRVQIRQGNGVPVTVFECTGDTGDWQVHRADLSRFLDKSNLLLNVHLFADEETADDGFYLDDIRVLAELPSGCPNQEDTGFVLSGDLSGTWFDPDQAGQGFVVEVAEAAGEPVVVVTWYTYEEGEPLWLIGSVPVGLDARSATMPLVRAAGTGFGDQFDPEAVELTPWGELTLTYDHTGSARIDYRRDDGIEGRFDLIRLTTGLSDDPVPGLSGLQSGAWFDLERAGEGITVELGRNIDGPVAIVTWYTYEDGRPVWLIGSASYSPAQDSIAMEMSSFRGTGFGAAFDPAEIVAEAWGTLAFSFDRCQSMQVHYAFDRGEGDLTLSRLTAGLLNLSCGSQ